MQHSPKCNYSSHRHHSCQYCYDVNFIITMPSSTKCTYLCHMYGLISAGEPEMSATRPFLSRYKSWKPDACAKRRVRDICILTAGTNICRPVASACLLPILPYFFSFLFSFFKKIFYLLFLHEHHIA